MKKIISLTIFILWISYLMSQSIGINTINPLELVHIETGSIGNADDIVITNNGRIGIDTFTPSEKIEIKGKIQLKDGSEGNGKALKSEADGTAQWSNLTLNAKSKWNFVNPAAGQNLATTFAYLQGTSSLSENQIKGLTTKGSNTVTVPPGYYIMILDGGITSSVTGGVRNSIKSLSNLAINNITEGVQLAYLISFKAQGAATIVQINKTSEIGLQLATRDYRDWVGIYAGAPLVNTFFSYSLTFIKL